MTETATKLRACEKCKDVFPLTTVNFKRQGRGHLHVCERCRLRKPPQKEDPPADVPSLLAELIRLAKSPRCAHCGAWGARNGNPPLCRLHR